MNLRKPLRHLALPFTLCMASSVQTALAAPKAQTPLSIATWNLEHFAAQASQGCRPRNQDELVALKAYADGIDADIVALQEVGSANAAHKLFPEDQWTVYFSQRPDSEAYECRDSGAPSTQQKVAFAVRKGLEVTQNSSLAEFGLDSPGLRHALELEVQSNLGAIKILNVHLKSGCFVDDHSRDTSKSCQTFTKQTALLDKWVENNEQQGQAYAVLGDFNHRLSAPYNRLTRTLADNTDGSSSSLINTTANLIGCHPYYAAPIDHILVGNLPQTQFAFEAEMLHYNDMQPDKMLSDHCAVKLAITPTKGSLTNAVKWQTQSAEYAYLTTKIYRQATKRLATLVPENGAWAVVMDVDETILDNSPYQVTMDTTGQSFSPETWDAWVASEKAEMVPGAAQFMRAVLEQGGKLALVTNRNRALDHHTWRNLLAHDLPLTKQNTCLMGRIPEDKNAIDGKLVKNDKDLRRQQISTGTASCYSVDNSRHSEFGEHHILMQVGDNIEDYTGVLQEHADVEHLLELQSVPFVLLPNPMYGSWR